MYLSYQSSQSKYGSSRAANTFLVGKRRAEDEIVSGVICAGFSSADVGNCGEANGSGALFASLALKFEALV